eukprot:TRINITY_DN444_c0_g1_i1.p1 TRINITY_DN444_c0_g1~~TRINITY_DN444_c0_g1_i1.p1  ORF type:complete len:865 (-),score=201.22 TRINITY_DN444_c0_g1_i1:286-2880(-)
MPKGGWSYPCKFYNSASGCLDPNCRFAHVAGDSWTESGPPAKRRKAASRFEGGEAPSSLCKHWAAGSCRDGKLCLYAHGEHELQGYDPYKEDRFEGRPPPKAMCKHIYSASGCEKAFNCPYAHTEEELNRAWKPVSRFEGGTSPSTRCKYMLQKGRCDNGVMCRFAHSDDELDPEVLKAEKQAETGSSAEVNRFEGGSRPATRCKFMLQSGSCKKGDDCLFAHNDSELESSTRSEESTSKWRPSKTASWAEPPQQPMHRFPDGNLPKKRCRFMQKLGYCKNGDACTFAHNDAELNPSSPEWEQHARGSEAPPPADAVADTAAAQQGLNRFDGGMQPTVRCKFFAASGSCKNGARCRFAHSDEELDPSALEAEAEAVLASSVVEEGDVDPALEAELQEAPLTNRFAGGSPPSRRCKYMVSQGKCKNGDKCLFAHNDAELDPATLEKEQQQRDVQEAEEVAAAAAAVAAPVMTRFTGGTPPKERCKFMVKLGYCRNGDQCLWAHSDAELDPEVLQAELDGHAAPLAGGEEQAHERSPAPPAYAPPAQKSQGPDAGTRFEGGSLPQVWCRHYWSREGCRSADRCTFAHSEAELDPAFRGKEQAQPPRGHPDAPASVDGACFFFGTPQGCKRGAACPFTHEEPVEQMQADTSAAPSGSSWQPPRPKAGGVIKLTLQKQRQELDDDGTRGAAAAASEAARAQKLTPKPPAQAPPAHKEAVEKVSVAKEVAKAAKVAVQKAATVEETEEQEGDEEDELASEAVEELLRTMTGVSATASNVLRRQCADVRWAVIERAGELTGPHISALLLKLIRDTAGELGVSMKAAGGSKKAAAKPNGTGGEPAAAQAAQTEDTPRRIALKTSAQAPWSR